MSERGTSEAKTSRFNLESLEPRVLLSGDSVLLAEVQRSLEDGEARAASAPVQAIVEQIDASSLGAMAPSTAHGSQAAGDHDIQVTWGSGWLGDTPSEPEPVAAWAESDQAEPSTGSDESLVGVREARSLVIRTAASSTPDVTASAAADRDVITEESFVLPEGDSTSRPPATGPPAISDTTADLTKFEPGNHANSDLVNPILADGARYSCLTNRWVSALAQA